MSSEILSDPAPAGLSGHAFSSLFQAVAGLRNRRALVAMLGCTVRRRHRLAACSSR